MTLLSSILQSIFYMIVAISLILVSYFICNFHFNLRYKIHKDTKVSFFKLKYLKDEKIEGESYLIFSDGYYLYTISQDAIIIDISPKQD